MSSRCRKSIDDLPENILFDILSRLHVKTIIHCRFVCKNWRNLISDSYFVNLHLSRSPAGLMIHHNSEKDRSPVYEPGILKWVVIKDEPDHHLLHHDSVMSLDLNLATVFQNSQILQVGSVNGLLCLWQFGRFRDETYICNPTTREYMTLPRQKYYREGYAIIVYGFGVGLQTNEYKVIRIFQGDIPPNPSSTSRPSLLEAEVYTLGSGQWRQLGHVPYWLIGYYGPFLNGHVHWIVLDEDSQEKLCAFNIDNETFELFPSPPLETIDQSQNRLQSLGVLKGCLCESDIYDGKITIWVMKEYGIKKSWHKEVVINQTISYDPEEVHLLEYLKDGTILIEYGKYTLLAYSTWRKTLEDTRLFEPDLSAITYRPSFLKLQEFQLEKVDVFEMPT